MYRLDGVVKGKSVLPEKFVEHEMSLFATTYSEYNW